VAFEIAGYLADRLGQQVVPVHPQADPYRDSPGYPRLVDIPGRIDVVDVFVRSDPAGLDVVMDACPAIEAPRLGLIR